MKTLALALLALLALIQYPLWIGKGGWLRVWELDRQVAATRQGNATLAERNAALEAEVRDLRGGTQAVEERARYELGMVRPDEVFVQYTDSRPQRIAPVPAEPAPIRPGSAALRVSAPASGSQR